MSIRRLALLALALLASTAVHAAAPPLPADLVTQLGLPANVVPVYVPIATSPDAHYTPEQAAVNAPDILSVAACHVGGNRLLLRITFAQPPVFLGATFIVYMDLDGNPATGRVDPQHGGTDAQLSFADNRAGVTYYGSFNNKNTGFRTAIDGNLLYVAVDAPFRRQGDAIPFSLDLLSERKPGSNDGTRRADVLLPISAATVPVLPLGKPGLAKSLRDYRYYNDRVMYEKLADKGMTYAQVAPKTPIQFGRPRPEPTFATQPRAAQPGKASLTRVPVEVLEEQGVARRAALSFGFPLAQGDLFDVAKIRLLEGAAELPAQFTGTSFWPDGSLKWVLVDAVVALKANERRGLVAEFGGTLKHDAPAGRQDIVQVTEEAARFLITSGGVQYTINKDHFNLLADVRAAAAQVAAFDPAGVTLTDEAGKRFAMSLGRPDSVKLEVNGPQKVVLRAEGPYTAADGSTYQRWIARLSFRAGSPRVDLALTQVNDYTRTEFTDLTSLELGLNLPGLANAVLYGEGLKPLTATSLVQLDDQRLQADAASASGKAPGLITWDGGSAIVHDFWQRWPKSLARTEQGLSFGLLPRQPSADYGKDLPYYLMYNFVEGKYRAKWGMAFTTRLTVDFGGKLKPEELYAEAQAPALAVIPASWYAQTGALGPLAAPLGQQFALWDTYVDSCFKDNERTRQTLREYGYYNYGDWFGERGRNWGNNEYDIAHGLFMQFARTGNRDMARWARISSQHRADTDTVWAYPDPYYVGGNHLHSIGHSGTWTQDVERATWSHKHEMHTAAGSGHVWADGLMDDWYLTGEPRAVESALALGEHCAYAFAPTFNALGTHERSAGWSLRAVMAIYDGTYDPVYLAAAKRIAQVPLREQKFDQGGAWPHVLPGDHAGDTPGAVGNNLFLIGVLLGGLQAYHEASRDPAVLKALESGAAWVVTSWDEKRGGWPYSAAVDGRRLYDASTGLNQLIITPLAYVGRLTHNEKLLQIADQALSATVMQTAGGNGKGMSQQAFFTSGVLAELQRWYAATRPDQGATVLDGSPAMMAQLLVKTAASDRFSVRAPDQKLFVVRLEPGLSTLKVSRKPHGAMNKRAEFATVKITDLAGKVVAQDRCSTDDKREFSFSLDGKNSAQFNLVIDDDQRGVWNVAGESLRIVAKVLPDFRLGGVGRSRYYFMVPTGTKEFTFRLVGVHTGSYGAVVLTPGAELAGSVQGSNPGAALIQGSAGADTPRPADHPELSQLTIKPLPADTGKVWSVLLSAAGDIGLQIENLPPYLSLSPEGWFQPQE
jgi:hypothetical protein